MGSSLLVSFLWFFIWFPVSINVRLYFGAKMVTFCIIHIGNRKILLKHHPPPLGNRKILLKHHPPPQLILLHVSVFSYFTQYMWQASWDSGGGIDIPQPKCDVWASPNISIWICSLENLFFQYNEIICTSKLPFHFSLPISHEILQCFSIFFFRLWKLSFYFIQLVDYFAHILY